MPKTKVALTLDADLLDRVDHLVAKQRFRNRSQAIETALAEKLSRLARTHLGEECAKLDPTEERLLADEGLAAAADTNSLPATAPLLDQPKCPPPCPSSRRTRDASHPTRIRVPRR